MAIRSGIKTGALIPGASIGTRPFQDIQMPIFSKQLCGVTEVDWGGSDFVGEKYGKVNSEIRMSR